MKQTFSALFMCVLVCALSAGPSIALPSDQITAFEAAEHVGSTIAVCGHVASANYAVGSQGKPTFLNLEKAYPNHIFTAIIFDDYRHNFDYAPESLAGRDICVHGLIENYKGKPQIKVRGPNQITIN